MKGRHTEIHNPACSCRMDNPTLNVVLRTHDRTHCGYASDRVRGSNAMGIELQGEFVLRASFEVAVVAVLDDPRLQSNIDKHHEALGPANCRFCDATLQTFQRAVHSRRRGCPWRGGVAVGGRLQRFGGDPRFRRVGVCGLTKGGED